MTQVIAPHGQRPSIQHKPGNLKGFCAWDCPACLLLEAKTAREKRRDG